MLEAMLLVDWALEEVSRQSFSCVTLVARICAKRWIFLRWVGLFDVNLRIERRKMTSYLHLDLKSASTILQQEQGRTKDAAPPGNRVMASAPSKGTAMIDIPVEDPRKREAFIAPLWRGETGRGSSETTKHNQ